MNRQILRLAIPNVISNITIPLLGMVDIAVAGRLGHDASIGAIAIGTTIFNFIYWNCAFIRMGTSGMTAQAYGAGDKTECANLLIRSVMLALIIALLLFVLQRPVGRLSFMIMRGSDEVNALASEYFYARIWAVPAAISMFSLHGWFIGMQDANTPMIVAIVSNIINVLFCILFVFRYDMGLAGIGWAAVVAQYSGVLLSWIIWVIKYHDYASHIVWKECLNVNKTVRFLHINKDIFLRTLCVVIAYTFFTSASAEYGDTVLATNAILMQLFTLYSYMSDGFGYAAESLAGKFVGARDEVSLKKCIRYLCWWGFAISACYTMVYVVEWRGVLSLFTQSAAILDCAGEYIEWVILIPLLSFFPFLVDGIMIGATKTKVLRNTVFVSLVLYFAVYFSMKGMIGNNSVWLAFAVFIVSRGVLLYFATGKLDTKKMINKDYNY